MRSYSLSAAPLPLFPSFDMNAGLLDELRPLIQVMPDIAGELLGRIADRIRSQAEQALLHVRRSKHRGDIGLQFAHRLCRRSGRGEQSIPGADVEARISGLCERRYFRQ